MLDKHFTHQQHLYVRSPSKEKSPQCFLIQFICLQIFKETPSLLVQSKKGHASNIQFAKRAVASSEPEELNFTVKLREILCKCLQCTKANLANILKDPNDNI